jgi:hypothetical protein
MSTESTRSVWMVVVGFSFISITENPGAYIW